MHRDAIVIVESEAYRSNSVVETTLRHERAARADHLLADIPVRVSSAVRSLGWSFLPEDNIITVSADMSFPKANLIPATGDHLRFLVPPNPPSSVSISLAMPSKFTSDDFVGCFSQAPACSIGSGWHSFRCDRFIGVHLLLANT